MAVLTTAELEAKREELVQQFNNYATQVKDGLDEVNNALSLGEYARACAIMNTISSHQAQSSIKMRAVLVKFGFIVRERSDV